MAIKSQRAKEGYLLIDHRASPGTAEIPEGATYESATITCHHCGSIVVLNPKRTRPRTYCSKCDGYVCDVCASFGECTPIQELIDACGANKLEQLLQKRRNG